MTKIMSPAIIRTAIDSLKAKHIIHLSVGIFMIGDVACIFALHMSILLTNLYAVCHIHSIIGDTSYHANCHV